MLPPWPFGRRSPKISVTSRNLGKVASGKPTRSPRVSIVDVVMAYNNLACSKNNFFPVILLCKHAVSGQLAYSWFWPATGRRRVRVFIPLFAARCARRERVRIFIAPRSKGTSFCFAGHAVWGGVRIFQAKPLHGNSEKILGGLKTAFPFIHFLYKMASFGQLAYSLFWPAPGCPRVRV